MNKKGFTLVELLAVIVILAIIMIIATMNVGKVITRSRTQAFESNMDLAVKNAKRILETEGKLDAISLKESLNYNKGEFNYQVIRMNGGYVIKLISDKDGKFKNVDLIQFGRNDNYIYVKDARGIKGRNIIGFKINESGNLERVLKNDFPYKYISEETLLKGCTTNGIIKKNAGENYSVGDVISFCNEDILYASHNSGLKYYEGKSEDFYVIKDNGTTVTALAKNILIIGKEVQYLYKNSCEGLQDYTDDTRFSIAFADKDPSQNYYLQHGLYLGYWAKEDGEPKNDYKKEELSKTYPVIAFSEESLLWPYLRNYESYFNNILNKKTAKMRLITYSELKELGCEGGSCNNENTQNKTWIYGKGYWSASAYNASFMYGVTSNGNFTANRFWTSDTSGPLGVRPVIEINKSEL